MAFNGFNTVYFYFQAQQQGGINFTAWIIGLILVVLAFAVLLRSSRRTRNPAPIPPEDVGAQPIPTTGADVSDNEPIEPPDPVTNIGEIRENPDSLIDRDDLTVIDGIGPAMQEILNENGISTYEKLAEADPAILKNMLMDVGLKVGQSDRVARTGAAGATKTKER